jgi:peptidoglycan/LPS O-acetylase OafA/YrhL
VRISQHVGFTRYGEALADSSLDLVVGLGAGMAVAAGFGWRRSRALQNDWQRGVIALLSVVGALIMAFLAVPFWHFFHFIGLTFWTLVNVALAVAGSAWAVKGSRIGEG